MFNRNIFAERFKLLRTAHYLSSSQLAALLKFKSKGSIGNLESGKSAPLADNLVDISNLFSVSLDWLTGRSDIPYTNEILLQLEPLMIDCSRPYFDYYKDINKRCTFYPLPIRANISFIINIFTNGPTISTMPTLTQALSKKYIPALDISEYMNHPSRKQGLSIDYILKGLLENDITKPVFDISVSSQSEQKK